MRNEFEYAAWLQPETTGPLPTLRLNACGVNGFLAEEALRFGNWRESEGLPVTLAVDRELPTEGFTLKGCAEGVTLRGGSEAGLLYGIYAFHDSLRLGKEVMSLDITSSPVAPRRVLNHWDNLTGHIERGYAGGSLFFKDGALCHDPARIRDYARLLASIGINQVCLNNVNVTPEAAQLITERHLPALSVLAGIFRDFFIRLVIAVDFSSPRAVGGLATSDPLDDGVAAWWKTQADTVYRHIPDLAGFLVKADSEFREGPAAMGRTQADGANVIARALAAHNGVVYWRCFVYNCQQDWRDTKTDRARAAYDHFKPLDGSFEDNVILQIKNGPMDFQVREPVSPLLGAMPQTRQALELQVTQEYTGQQIDLCALASLWEEVLVTNLHKDKKLADLIGPGCTANPMIDTVCAVANTGLDDNWTGHTLAQANLYAFGKLAWNPCLTAAEILSDWTRLTFGLHPAVTEPVTKMLQKSRDVYEKYNAPLGIGWMVNINHHYGPSVDGYEYMKWGTYHRANHNAIGVDRTDNGTGYTAQYDPWLKRQYDDVQTCPEELLLFFHRLPYDFILRSGKTLLQHIYDTHFEGAVEVEYFIRTWDDLQDQLPPPVYASVAERFKRQLVNAREWRDVVNTYFYRLTGIPDAQGRKIYE